MALALSRRSSDPAGRRFVGWRTVLASAAVLTLLLGVALSGGFRLAEPPAAVTTGGETGSPVFDGRGKWTGYAR